MDRERIVKQSEKNRKHRNHSLRRFFLYMVLLIVLYVGFGLLARMQSLQVTVGDFENIVVTDTDQMKEAVDIYLTDRFLYPSSNVIWFSERKLERYLGVLFPRLDTIDVSFEGKRKLRIWASERQGEFLWCGNEVEDIRVENICYFADGRGFVFDEAPFFAGATFVRLYSDLGDTSPVGQESMEPEIFTVLKNIQEILRPYNFNIQALVQYPDSQYGFVLNSKQPLSRAPQIKFAMLPDFESSLKNLSIALSKNDFVLEIREQYDMLEYLDIRFTGQVVYKFRDPNAPVVTEVEEDSQDEEYVEENLEQTISEEIVSDDTEG